MLKKLSIQNYALIRELELPFDSGFNIITGETGAGKSIIIGALGLILGNRADVSVLNLKDQKCVVEAVFDMDNEILLSFFQKYEIDIEDIILIRRQINPQGKSRAFINDTPVKLPVLRELSSFLIDVNSQHQTFSLNDAGMQLQLLDDYAGLAQELALYKENYKHYKILVKELAEIEERERKAKAEQDYLQFQFEELENAKLEVGQFESLDSELKVISHAEEIISNLFEAEQSLQSNENGALEKIASINHHIRNISNFHNDYELLSNRLESVLLELQDIAQEIENSKDQIEFNPARMEELSNRIDLLNHLQQKHLLNSADDLIELKNSIEAQLLGIGSIGVEKDDLQSEIAILFDKITNQADRIHDSRRQNISEVQRKVVQNLTKLGMKGSQFVIELKKEDTLNESGISKLQFLFSANKGIDVASISKVASGGELSRLMLTLKSVLTSKKALSTIIFDEIDTGVSGDIANKVGDMMKSMGKKLQLIAITHLPHIAGKAGSHYKVYKHEEVGRTYSSIRLLKENERVEELSLMISGNKNSEAGIATALELMAD